MSSFLPQQTVIVTSRCRGFDNATTFSWHTPLSQDPFLYGIVVRKSRKIYDMIIESKVFCINFLPHEMERLALYCGTKSGHKIDKFREGKIEREECRDISCPRISGCAAYLECRLIDAIEVGDHVLLRGRVVREVVGKDAKRLFEHKSGGFTTTLE